MSKIQRAALEEPRLRLPSTDMGVTHVAEISSREAGVELVTRVVEDPHIEFYLRVGRKSIRVGIVTV